MREEAMQITEGRTFRQRIKCAKRPLSGGTWLFKGKLLPLVWLDPSEWVIKEVGGSIRQTIGSQIK